jgi:hypothetical protein
MTEDRARYGWESDFPTFREALPSVVRERLHAFVADATPEQIRAWTEAIPPLQTEIEEVLATSSLAARYSTILEYELPMESRRPDVVLLVGAGVVVIELKGKKVPSQADIDQASAYARDLRCYHRECANRSVVPVLVPTRARGYQSFEVGVHIMGPDALDSLIEQVASDEPANTLEREAFLSGEAYCPLPTLVEAARELFARHDVRWNQRARAATDPAVNCITRIVHEAAASRSRHLILLTGVPGAGKTLVGLRTVHAPYLDDLAVERAGARPTSPAVFLSGNGPLVEVLQYELRAAGGDGKAFVRGVKEYVKRYTSKRSLVPPEHVLVFDEAQRAFDAEMVFEKHPGLAPKSEAEHFIEFAERVPEWCVVIGLVGTGQEIHRGEEGGLIQWRWAVEKSSRANEWTVHAPSSVARLLESPSIRPTRDDALNLDTVLRSHAAGDLHLFVGDLLSPQPASSIRVRAERLERDGFHWRLTRSLNDAKSYLRERYESDASARFGMIASSKDKDLERFDIPNDFQSTKRMRLGPWYGDDESDYEKRSCRHLVDCVTEFGAQGLELDATLLAWGTDLLLVDGQWSNAYARGYQKGKQVKDPLQLRVNAYRVLLTRARDACVVFIPPLALLDETHQYLSDSGFRTLG